MRLGVSPYLACEIEIVLIDDIWDRFRKDIGEGR